MTNIPEEEKATEELDYAFGVPPYAVDAALEEFLSVPSYVEQIKDGTRKFEDEK